MSIHPTFLYSYACLLQSINGVKVTKAALAHKCLSEAIDETSWTVEVSRGDGRLQEVHRQPVHLVNCLVTEKHGFCVNFGLTTLGGSILA